MKNIPLKRFLLLLIDLYQRLISPLFPPSCRYYPSCSHYAHDAIEKFGPVKGSYKAIIRILKCNPFFPGGYDPV